MRDLVLPALGERRARRAFAEEHPDLEQEEALWEAVGAAPSHGNVQPTRLLIPRQPAVRDALIAALSEGNRTWASRAPLLVGLGVLPGHEYTRSYGDDRALWALHAGIALGNLMAQATAMGLVAHPMAGFDEAEVRQAFDCPDELRVLVVVAIGFPGDPASLPPDLRQREGVDPGRIPLSQLVVEDRWREEHGISARELRRQ